MTPEGKVTELLLRLTAKGFARKVEWSGRNGAPDWVVCMPGYREVWLELKAAGKAAMFPSNAHERMQAREHERMQAVGMLVYVVDNEKDILNAIHASPLAASRD